MVPSVRKKYNEEFTQEKYKAFLDELEKAYPSQLDFRIAETPVFIDKKFTAKVLAACEHIIDVVSTKEYLQKSEKAIPPQLAVPGQNEYPHFIAFDFGICVNEQNELEPQLIEMQGFPSLFAWQLFFPAIHARHLYQPSGYSPLLNGLSAPEYIDLLKKIIIADARPENVILLELFPQQQKTRIDFVCTETYLGIKTVCLTELIQEGKELYYMLEGKKTRIERIYNRLIFDELLQQSTVIQDKGKIFQQELDVEWIPHPNWFFKISKFTLPFLDHPYIPTTRFLSEVNSLPGDLENYVVKPLFSFAGQGVIIDVTTEAVDEIKDRANWILQKKVNYAPVIVTPDEPAKAELRIFYFWEPGKARPVATNNLARLSKGKMVGVRYNKDKEWVGGSFALFEK